MNEGQAHTHTQFEVDCGGRNELTWTQNVASFNDGASAISHAVGLENEGICDRVSVWKVWENGEECIYD